MIKQETPKKLVSLSQRLQRLANYELIDFKGESVETFRLYATAKEWKKKLEKIYGKLEIKKIN